MNLRSKVHAARTFCERYPFRLRYQALSNALVHTGMCVPSMAPTHLSVKASNLLPERREVLVAVLVCSIRT